MARKNEEQQAIEIRTRWFPDHRALLTNLEDGVSRLVWRNPKNSNYAVRYVLDHGALLVWGDIGEAVYRWNDLMTFAALARVDLHYFHSKLCASEKGRDFYAFDYESVQKAVREFLLENPRVAKKWDDETQIDEINCEESARHIIGTMPIEPETMSGLLHDGRYIHPRVMGHWIGLKMAQDFLLSKPTAVAQP